MATLATNDQTVQSSYNPNKSINVYASGQDLADAQAKYNGTKGVNFIDTSAKDFNPNSMRGGVLLGGTGVNTNISNAMSEDALKNYGVQRIWGNTASDTANAFNNYMSSYGKPETPTASPTPISTPTYTPFSFEGNMQTYLDQAQNLLKPQYDLSVKQLNTNYDTNVIPGVNNDSLKRGLARSSYAGNRVDQANVARQNELDNLSMAQQQQVNNMAMQNYNTAYDRAYKGWGDTLNNNWKTYDAQNNANQQQFQNNMSLYNTANQDYWNTKNYGMEQDKLNWQKILDKNNESWKHITFDYNKGQDAFNNNLKQQDFDRQGLWHDQAQALAEAKAASGGSGGSGGSRRSVGGSSSNTKLTAADKSNMKGEVMSQLQGEASEGLGRNYLMKYKDNIINDLGESYFKELVNEAEKHGERGGNPSGWDTIVSQYKK